MAEPRFCFQHPTRIARRKCFICERPLCPDCQIKRDHHLFCTDLCHKNYLRTVEVKKPNPYTRYVLYAGSLVLVGGLVYFALLADAFYTGGDRPANANPTPKSSVAPIAPSLPVESPNPPKETINISRPVNGMKSASQTIEVAGKAPKDAIVGLYLNGSLIESTLAMEASYNFPAVLLTKHANVIQTRFYKDESSNFSPAIMVFYQDTIQTTSGDWKFFQNSADNISRGNLSRKEIVLTFDGGSESNAATQILDILHEHHLRVTIFLTGEFISHFPEVTRRIASEHEVGNHTFSHEHLTTYAQDATQKTIPSLTREEFQDQLKKTEDIFYQTTGKKMTPLWRAPYGEHNIEIRRWAAELGYVHVAWTSDPKTHQNLDSLDWVPNASTPGYFPAMLIKDRILSFNQNEPEQANGGIVLMHLGTERTADDQVYKWLPEIIKTFRQRGYQFITAGELIDHQDLLPNVATK
ncbi:MAG: hypothetical protein C5B54_08645 [Acidobacteria bacterium]|nr:MAG: hypothetical protein C5B54_08645 [Acidobacteriota bacterium]